MQVPSTGSAPNIQAYQKQPAPNKEEVAQFKKQLENASPEKAALQDGQKEEVKTDIGLSGEDVISMKNSLS